jgi:hypothetical protein
MKEKAIQLKNIIIPNDWFVAGWIAVGVIVLVDFLNALR